MVLSERMAFQNLLSSSCGMAIAGLPSSVLELGTQGLFRHREREHYELQQRGVAALAAPVNMGPEEFAEASGLNAEALFSSTGHCWRSRGVFRAVRRASGFGAKQTNGESAQGSASDRTRTLTLLACASHVGFSGSSPRGSLC
jgi:hypothetical protein